jgi:hypothetical protein
MPLGRYFVYAGSVLLALLFPPTGFCRNQPQLRPAPGSNGPSSGCIRRINGPSVIDTSPADHRAATGKNH